MTENQNFEMFKEVAHNFGKSEEMLISTRCIRGFMPNSIEKSVMVSIRYN